MAIPIKEFPDIRFPYSLFDDIKPGKYASNHVASWTEKLEPRENHWDRRITLKTPLQEAGLYVVTLRFDESSSMARCLVWIQDTAILRKPLDQKHLYYVADAKHGLPQAGWNVEFFGIRHNNNSGNQRGQKVWNTTNFSKKTDNQGQLLLSPEQEQTTYQWMVIARDGKGKLATLGTEWVGLMSRHFEQWNQLKAYGVSDRPVYKPGDKAHLKLWIARAAYAPMWRAHLCHRKPSKFAWQIRKEPSHWKSRLPPTSLAESNSTLKQRRNRRWDCITFKSLQIRINGSSALYSSAWKSIESPNLKWMSLHPTSPLRWVRRSVQPFEPSTILDRQSPMPPPRFACNERPIRTPTILSSHTTGAMAQGIGGRLMIILGIPDGDAG